MPCKECGKEVRMPRHRWATFRFCSYQCNWNWQNKHNRISRECAICNSQFTVIKHRKDIAKYCSRKCYYKAQHLKGSIKKQCPECGKKFRTSPSKNKIFCSGRCLGHSQLVQPAKYQSAIKRKVLALGLHDKCLACGYKEHPEILELHHIDGNRENGSWNNLTLICPNCHKLHHFKTPNLSFIPLSKVMKQIDTLQQSILYGKHRLRRHIQG